MEEQAMRVKKDNARARNKRAIYFYPSRRWINNFSAKRREIGAKRTGQGIELNKNK